MFYQEFPTESPLRTWFDNHTFAFARYYLAFDDIGASTTWIHGRQQNKTLHFYDSYEVECRKDPAMPEYTIGDCLVIDRRTWQEIRGWDMEYGFINAAAKQALGTEAQEVQ